MSELVTDFVETGKARIVDAPDAKPEKVLHQVEHDRSFELPTGLFATTVACYLGFLGLTLAAFATPELGIPMAIFAFIIVAGFAVPTVWTRLKPDDVAQPKSWGVFMNEGIMTNTGRCSARDATIQMLILPVLIVLWGVAVVTIAALV